MDLTPEQSHEHARLLNEFVRAQERYKSLLPRVRAPDEAVAVAVGASFPRSVQEADRDRFLAGEALFTFRETHGIPW